MVWMAGDFFYPLSNKTLATFLFGGVALSAGSMLPLLWSSPATAICDRKLSPGSNRLLNISFVIVVCALPFTLLWLRSVTAQSSTNFLVAAYIRLGEDSVKEQLGYKFFANIVNLAAFVSMIAFFENQGARWRSRLAVSVALVLYILTGGRIGFTTFLLTLIWLDWFRGRQIRWKMLFATASVCLVLLSAVAVVIGKGGAKSEQSVGQNLKPVAEGLLAYSAGGMVSFDRVVREPGIVPSAWPFYIFFSRTAKRMGADIELPGPADYITVGPASLQLNVYSIYWSYIDIGYGGMIAAMFMLGLLASLIYKGALNGGPICRYIYGGVFAGLLLSVYSEFLVIPLYQVLKEIAMVWAIYSFPSAWRHVSAVARTSVTAAIARRRSLFGA
jgi:oligosaccharide repeat unit polymerase